MSGRAGDRKWLVVALLSTGLAIDYLARLALFSVVPLWRKELAASDAAVGLVASSFLWTYGALSPAAGYLGDRFSRRAVLIASMSAWSAVTLLSGFATGAWQLVAMRILLAVTQVGYMPVAQALISDFHGPETRGRASGYLQCGSSVGIFLSGLPVAWLATHFGWRPMLMICGGAGLVFAAVMLKVLPGAPKESTHPLAQPVSLRETAALLRIPSILVLMLTFSMTSIAYWVLFSYLPLFIYEQYHMSLESAAFQATFYIQASAVALMPLYATLSDRLTVRDARNRYLACGLASALGLPALLAVGASQQPAVLTGGLILFGLVMASSDCSWLAMLCNVTTPRQRASAYGLLNFAGTLTGGFAAMFTALAMKALGLGVIIASIGLTYALIAGLLLLCGYVLLRRDGPRAHAAAVPIVR